MAEIKKYLDTTALGTLVDQIKAEDAKTLAAAKAHAEGLGANYDAAGAAATAKTEAIEAAEEKVAALADGQVKLNKEAIEKLNGADTVEGSVAKAVKDAKDALQANIDVVDEKAIANANAIAAINNETTGILAQAKADATGKANAVQEAVDALGEYVGEFESEKAKTVVEYIDEKTSGIASDAALTELAGRVSQAEADIDNIEKDYLKAADKTELEGKIKAAQDAADAAQGEVDELEKTHAEDKKSLEDAIALKADQTALDAVSAVANAAVKQSDYDVKIKALEDEDARIVDLVEAEVERAAGVEAGLEERLVEVETFFKTAEGETIDQAMDTLVEIQKYITEDGTAADEMIKDIAANEKAIADHIATDHDFGAADDALKADLEAEIAKKADKTTVEGIDGRLTTAEGKITTVEGKVSTLEGEMDAVEGAVATKAEQSALEAAVEALEGADAGQVERIAALEAKFGEGEGSVADQIADAKQEAIDAAAEDATDKADKALEDAKAYADAEDAKIESRVDALEAASATHALASDLTTLAGRVTTAEGEIDTLQSEMDAVEAKAAANETAIGTINTELAKKAAQTDLEAAVARIAVNEGAITTINGTLAEKAEADDLDAAVERIAANEAAIAANTSAINSFTAITPAEVEALFA